jgi:hypothetical protein
VAAARQQEEKMTSLAKIVLAAAVGAISVASLSVPASANDTSAFIGGLAIGTFAGAAIAGGSSPPPVVYGRRPVYDEPVYYQRRCWYEAEPVYNMAGYQVGTQTVKHCR